MRIRGTLRDSREGASGRAHGTENAASPLAGLQRLADGSTTVQRLAVMQAKGDTAGRREDGGLPQGLRAGVEALSGMAMADVRVHYNSSRPATLQAHAYAQGSDIHVAPGQEQHLPHEAWHVVQQKQGRVRPTMNLDGTAVNDDPALEAEADSMGARALSAQPAQDVSQREEIAGSVAQRAVAQLDGVSVSSARRVHILDGDSTGGGHRSGTGKPGKSEFPPSWSDDKIISVLEDVALSGGAVGGADAKGRIVKTKAVDGVMVKVVIEADGGIVTGFPTEGEGVIRNPW